MSRTHGGRTQAPGRRRSRVGTPTARILIIEDDESVAVTLGGILKAAGYAVEHTTRVAEALARMERVRFDATLLDLRVGDSDGLTVLRRLRERWPGAVGIVLTGSGSVETAAEAMRAGADDFVLEPSDPTELKAALARAMHWRAQLDQRAAELAHARERLGAQAAEHTRRERTLSRSQAQLVQARQLADEREQLRRLAEERVRALEDLDRLKEEFIATASHDLKAPLTSIRGYTQLLLRQMRGAAPDLGRVVTGLAIIEAQTEAMTRLLDGLLDASRIQAGVLDVRTQPCELGECLATVLARLSPLERERVDVALPDAPVAGEWDRTRIEQVLANLISNALKYSTERVSVGVERRAREVEVAVTDRGMGIPPEELPRLFERFHRTPQALASGLPGSGLGLYICWGVVVAHGGRIWAESPGVGHGTVFRFTLPSPAPPPALSVAGDR